MNDKLETTIFIFAVCLAIILGAVIATAPPATDQTTETTPPTVATEPPQTTQSQNTFYTTTPKTVSTPSSNSVNATIDEHSTSTPTHSTLLQGGYFILLITSIAFLFKRTDPPNKDK